MTLRDPKMDLLKEGLALRKARKTRCTIEGCNKFLTAYQGPGSDTLCREHQKNLSEYGGMATTKKSYSQSRETHCSSCGYTPYSDEMIQSVEDPKMRNQIIRYVLHVDHIDGNHENNAPENLQTLCSRCHSIKTVINGDTLSPSNQFKEEVTK